MKRRDTPPPGEEPSRGQRKRDMQQLQALGERLSRLRPEQVRALPADQELIDAILAVQGMGPSEHRRRQLQLIGKLMRGEAVDPLVAACEQAASGGQEDAALLRSLEDWRARLLAGGEEAVAEAVRAFPGADEAQLRKLVADARREQERGKPPASARKLFRYLRQLA